MKILLLSAYDAQSHQYWRTNLVAQFPEYDWTALSLPARYFSWRLRGNSLTWAFNKRSILEQPFDLMIATSMTDLSALKGLVPNLANIPSWVYFHENQFAYPESAKAFESVEPKILNLYTALAADQITFNSQYNQDTFLAGCNALLNKLPDHVPRGVIERIEKIASVLPVPLHASSFCASLPNSDKLEIIWNHRWEYDKGPQALLEAVRRLKAQTNDFRLHIVGQQFRQIPAAFDQLKKEFQAHIGAWGYVESQSEYQTLLQRSDVVISTALHDFQGMAILEAVAANCIPLVPNRLAYPELLGEKFCYDQGINESLNLATKLLEYVNLKKNGSLPAPPNISRLSWQCLRAHYQTKFTKKK
jgi:glycosyltransferase involved in cell wall biosynthesis